MTPDQAVALSLIPELPRLDLGSRLKADDPELLDGAAGLVDRTRIVLKHAASRNIHALPWNDPEFPSTLLAIPDFPPALWYRGTREALNAPAVAIVGSRAASAVALEIAERLADDLASAGIAVVSGLARGVDSAAHRGALRSGRTIAVLGSGVDHIYPREHTSLAGEIAVSGLVVSEYSPGTPPWPFHFPQRNRLISGLSRAVVVIEASERSGSLITAAWALAQGRDVMAVPGNVLSGRNRGGHALIRDGAKIVESADDIVEELGLTGLRCPASEGEGPAAPNGDRTASKAATCTDALLRAMEAGHVYDLDGLADVSGLDGARLLPRLLELELHGRVRRVGGGRFMRCS